MAKKRDNNNLIIVLVCLFVAIAFYAINTFRMKDIKITDYSEKIVSRAVEAGIVDKAAHQTHNVTNVSDDSLLSGLSPDKYSLDHCDGDIDLVINGETIFTVPKNAGYNITLNDNYVIEHLNQNSERHHCVQKTLAGVKYIRWDNHYLHAKQEPWEQTTYQLAMKRLQKAAEKAFAEQPKTETLNGGVTKLSHEDVDKEYYILPNDVARTRDGEAIAFECDKVEVRKKRDIKGYGTYHFPDEETHSQFCKTAYNLPNGFFFSYVLHGDETVSDNLIEKDRKKREWLFKRMKKAVQ